MNLQLLAMEHFLLSTLFFFAVLIGVGGWGRLGFSHSTCLSWAWWRGAHQAAMPFFFAKIYVIVT
jgi:hypothetical protein